MRSEAKVGLIVFSSIVTIIVIYWFLRGFQLEAASYPLYANFKDVQLLDRGAAVRMAGVRIGTVRHIDLTSDRTARVMMRIRRKYRIPRGTVATTTSGGLIGDQYVELTPGPGPGYHKPGDTVKTRQLVQLDDLMDQVGSIVTDLKGTTSAIRKILQDPELVKAAIGDLQAAAEEVAGAAREAKEMISDSRPEIASILDNAERITGKVAGISAQMDRILAQGGAEDIQAILANAAEASGRLATTSERLEKLASNQQLEENILATATNAREISERVNRMLDRLEKFTDRASRKRPSMEPKRPAEPLRSEGLRLDLLGNTGRGELRMDINYDFRFPAFLGFRPDPRDFYRIGLHNLGEDTGLNLQAGKILDNRSLFRYGLYASRVGVGYDRWLRENLSLHTDLFGLNDPQLEMRALYGVSPRWGLWLGATDLLDEKDVLFGARLNW